MDIDNRKKNNLLEDYKKFLKTDEGKRSLEQLNKEIEEEEKSAKYGWISIEEERPSCKIDDFFTKGYSEIEVRTKHGERFTTQVTDPNIWYYVVKDLDVVEWLKEK